MPQTYTVEGPAQQGRTYQNQHGELQVWLVPIQGEGMVELHKKPGNAPPDPGSQVFANIKLGEHDGRPFKRMYIEQQNGNQQSFGGSRGGGGDNPDTRLSIERQVAVKCATELMVGQMQAGNFNRASFAQDFAFYVDAIHGVMPSGGGAEQPKLTDDVPF